MKLVRYGERGAERPALIDATGALRDLRPVFEDIRGETLLPENLDRLSRVNPIHLRKVEGTPRLGPCVAGVSKIVGVGLNYRDHAAESGMPVPTEPVFFMKATSAIVGPHDDVEIPLGAQKVDWEVELGVVIGAPAKYVTVERAMEHVAGYCIVNDVSERNFQLERGTQWDKGKGHDTFAPLGPWLVTADEIPDPQNLHMWLEVDGHRYQNGHTRTMVFGVAELIAYISRFMTLHTGDIISTGTPPGVGLGQKPPKYLQAGQTMRLGIEGLGVQQQSVVPTLIEG